MRFTHISHACALIEHAGKRLLFDPWLEDSVYWGSWWHFPLPQIPNDIYNVDFIYLTHWHFDHMHLASLAKFSRHTHLLLPKFPVSGLPEPLRQLGFHTLTEMNNESTFTLAPGFRLTSYQVQLQDDSVAVVECEDEGRATVLVNLNDAKPLPTTWTRLTKRFPQVDLMLRSHSPAWSYPTAFTFDDPADAFPVTKATYAEAFYAAAEHLRPRYAVSFASGVCHLTEDTLFENQNLVLPRDVAALFAGRPLPGTTFVHVDPGGTFTPADGFTGRSSGPTLSDVERFVQEQRLARREVLDVIERAIDARELTLEQFASYFQTLRRRASPLWWFVRARWQFELVSSRGRKTYLYDFNRNRALTGEDSEGVTARFEIPEGILAEALDTMTFTNIDVAKRWRVHLARRQVIPYFLINTFLGLNEAGYLQIKNLFKAHLWTGLYRRRSEMLDYVRIAAGLFFKGKLSVVPAGVSERDQRSA